LYLQVEQSGDVVDSRIKEPMKIIHKEQDIITAFAINQVSIPPRPPMGFTWRGGVNYG
jgi:hypothetical protein